jgi:trans-aconitate 2-methyltransferase
MSEGEGEGRRSSEWEPEAYRRVSSLQQLVAERALADLQLAGPEDVLDVGCGDGRVTGLIAARLSTGSVLGVDPSVSMISGARRAIPAESRTRFQVASAATMDFEASFDVVTSFNALHWEVRWRQALVRIRAALRSGGRALLVFVCDGDRPSLEDVVTTVAGSGRWASAFEGFAAPYVHVDPEHYVSAAAAVGFRVDHRVVDDLSWDFGTRASFVDWCRAGLVAWTGRLAVELRDPFVEAVLDAYRELTGSDSRLLFLQSRFRLVAV